MPGYAGQSAGKDKEDCSGKRKRTLLLQVSDLNLEWPGILETGLDDYSVLDCLFLEKDDFSAVPKAQESSHIEDVEALSSDAFIQETIQGFDEVCYLPNTNPEVSSAPPPSPLHSLHIIKEYKVPRAHHHDVMR